jgi:hypothetical protein
MLAMPGLRAFSLSPARDSGRVSCDAQGVFVGDVPLLNRTPVGVGDVVWSVRPLAELNDELAACYRLPIDIAAKVGALALIASALNRSDLALAAIAAVQMQFPDPPPLAKGVESTAEMMRRALELYRSGLLKAGSDPTKHPRRGSPPNPGWFGPVDGDSSASESDVTPKRPDISPKGWPSNHDRSAGLKWLQEAAPEIVEIGGRFFLRRTPIGLAVLAFVKTLYPKELNRGEGPGIVGEQRLIDQMITSLDPPKTLEELQARPTENVLGYERHHIVEQNDYNLKKCFLEKFGRERIEDPDNIVWVPRLKHEMIAADYNRNVGGPGSPTLRQNIRNLDYDQQRAKGLEKLREWGVLK